MFNVDEISMMITKMPQNEERLSFTETGRRLRLSESTTRKQVQSLQERGVIRKFKVEVNSPKIGKNIVAIWRLIMNQRIF